MCICSINIKIGLALCADCGNETPNEFSARQRHQQSARIRLKPARCLSSPAEKSGRTGFSAVICESTARRMKSRITKGKASTSHTMIIIRNAYNA